ncbi:MAG: isoleucine--tRNA ligase [Atopococcus tabaci]|uniref:Isoleucine--tRNA ligase n=1 Tax=Atopococcus tabaci TaxID=269774 RepID=A0AA43UCF3_9LACT|nr:isoleucine--tRNA ligase [Atopococcus tabaci]
MKMKDTLLIGRTDFPMRANLPNKEAERQKEWEEQKVYERRLEKNKDNESFILHDGPPFANGNIHIGHALNKISKDTINRYKSMQGYYANFVPGWDTHGLPIEQKLKEKGVDRKSLSMSEYRQMCSDYAWTQINTQREDFKRLGVAGDWKHPYVTLQKDYEAAQIRVFGKMAEKGLIYRGKKPVYWSPSSESALAEAEIEYQDVRGPSIYVSFEVKDGKGLIENGSQFIIWTTTPWTIPSNLAIAVNPNYQYAVVETAGQKYIVAADLVDKMGQLFEWKDITVEKEILGADLEHMTAQHPFYDRESLLVTGDHVSLEEGTGLVHTAPGHGDDDYLLGVKYGLEILAPIDGTGHFTEEAPGFEGVFYDDANRMVTDKLKEKDQLLHMEFISHSYPHDWRTKQPIIFRATPQWFASIEKIREELLNEIDSVEWLLPSGRQRMYNMVEGRGDWVISRQRAWGVPLPVFYAENGQPILSSETTKHVADIFEKHGSNVWYEWEAEDLLPEGFTHPDSPNGEFTKETDIMDVWFDSGSSHEAVLRGREDLKFPADMYLEGSDQYRGYFNSSLTTSVAINGEAPYRSVLSQGFVLDGEGRKMSKSVGNVIAPKDVIRQMGADIIRLWVSTVDYTSDVRVSMDILKQVSESYRKIRNTLRFLIANTSDFNPEENTVAYDDLESLDQYMANRLNQVTKNAVKAYEKYHFQGVYREINNFCITDLSNFYLDIAKDLVYIETENSKSRRSMQTVMYQTLIQVTKLLTPIIPHTTEEVWKYVDEEEDYVQLAGMPESTEFENEEEILEKWSNFMDLRDDVLKALEKARDAGLIGKSFESEVTIFVNPETRKLLDSLKTNLQQVLIVSQLNIEDEEQAPNEALSFEQWSVLVEKKSGEVCERCWITSDHVGTIEEAPSLCDKCYTIVKEHYPEALEN